MAKITFLMLLLPLMMAGQVTDLNYHNDDSISFSYSKKIYQKIAVDTIKRIYDDQCRYYLKDGANTSPYIYPISSLYKWEELAFISVPYFRLARQANRDYTCESNIEDYIAFQERNKYQLAIVIRKGLMLDDVLIPDMYFEMERIFNPGGYTEVSDSDYKGILQRFQSSPRKYKEIIDVMEERSDNFFFGIYGLAYVLFEIDSKTGLLYANRMYDQVGRYLANDYLRIYEGEVKIRELARGYYEDIDDLGTLIERPCEKTDIVSKKVIIRVKNVD